MPTEQELEMIRQYEAMSKPEKEKPLEGLTVGRMVHFVFNERHCAAVITTVWGSSGVVNLHVFKDGSYPEVPETPTSVVFDNELKLNNTWHWIERA